MPLASFDTPFDHPDWIFELKYDGFRALAHIAGGACRLVSRNGNAFKRFPELCAAIAAEIPGEAVLDGEIVHVDRDGKPQFYDLMRRRGPQHFYAFDLLWFDGRDLRSLPLIERKRKLRRLVRNPVLFVDHVRETGVAFFEAVCARDLEGIVAKLADAPYSPESTSWVKIKNRAYSQAVGRHDFFNVRLRQRTAPGPGKAPRAFVQDVGR